MKTENATTKTDLYFPTIGENVSDTLPLLISGLTLLAIAKPSNLRGDEHIAMVICERLLYTDESGFRRTEYVVWTYNAIDRSMYCGHYYEGFRQAWNAFIKKTGDKING